MTVADIAIANCMFEMTAMIGEQWKAKFADFAKFVDEIMGLPNIKKWIETRPKTDM